MKIYFIWLVICFAGALVTGIIGKKKNEKGEHFIFWVTAPLFFLFGIAFFWKRRKEFALWWLKELFNLN